MKVHADMYINFLGPDVARGTAWMCEPAYSENNLNFRLVFLQKLDAVKEGILLELVLNIFYICHLEAKICPRNDTFTDPRLQRSKHSNNSDRSLEQQDMQMLG